MKDVTHGGSHVGEESLRFFVGGPPSANDPNGWDESTFFS